MSGLVSTLATIWRLATPYFRSEDRWAGPHPARRRDRRSNCRIVAINVLINQWNNRFYNALQDRNWDTFVSELLFFCLLAADLHRARGLSALPEPVAADPLAALDDRALPRHWLDNANHYRMQLLGDAADNPDQRIAEDIKLFIEKRALPSASACSARS